ncbi:M64 family metallopeptidase [Streptosporangium amethystogenes]|uniref:M64 family metallopeptidase n=1 Tax=Streptosporangium amethystogenes TaxID=2002 RepID=UPI00055EF601|nr:M64 family metallopeptidase [Streptosporangium amethystogenes]
MRRSSVVVATLMVMACLSTGPAHAEDPGQTRKVEVFGEHAPGGYTEVPVESGDKARGLAVPSATVTPIEVNGPSDKRIDLVYLGDGFTEAEQAAYTAQVANSWNILVQREPFKSYRKLFNVWQVNVVSNESGVDNDPVKGVLKDTALGGEYWCEDLERLVCVDIPTAQSYAALAPAFDQIAVVVNSPTYGGAGYIEENLVTFSGGHRSGPEILPHEFGHSIGDLADEYPYWAYPDDGSTYTGDEPVETNVSIYNAEQQTARRAKWWYWLGAETPDGGVIDTFEGAAYYNLGIYRPSDNSLMRSLLKPFNLVGREEMVRTFVGTTGLIDDSTPSGKVKPNSTLTVTPVGLPTVSTRWFVNGHEITEWAGRTSAVALTKKPKGHGKPEAPWCGRKDLKVKGDCVYSVQVGDSTDFVRNPVYKADVLTQSITWTIDEHKH